LAQVIFLLLAALIAPMPAASKAIRVEVVTDVV